MAVMPQKSLEKGSKFREGWDSQEAFVDGDKAAFTDSRSLVLRRENGGRPKSRNGACSGED